MTPHHLILASDISGLGKVAVTTALPLLAACQLEVAVLPTVILSSHTGGFSHIFRENYQHGLEAFLDQWRQLDLSFSAMVTGYVASSEQIDSLIGYAKEQALPLFVDPIMGDNGRLYQGFQPDFVASMRRLCQEAAVIFPNVTEACLLLHQSYQEGSYSPDYIQGLVQDLANELGCKQVLVTGIDLGEEIGVAYFDREKKNLGILRSPRLPGQFFGTGDMLTALVSAGLVAGISLEKSLALAMNFIEKSLRTSLEQGIDRQLGVYYQPHLAELVYEFRRLVEEKNES